MVVVKFSSLTAISLSLLFCSGFAFSSGKDLIGVLADFDRLRAEFTQQVYDEFGNALETSYGYLILRKPDIRWQTETPYKQTALLSANKLKVFDPDLEQLVIKDLRSDTDQIPLELLRRSEASLEGFDISEISKGAPRQMIFVLVPKSEEILYSKITMETLENKLRSISIYDLSGRRTKIELSNITPLRVDDLVPIIEVPPGTDIVDG